MILLQVIVLTTGKLNLVISVITSKGVNYSLIIDSSKEGLFLGHLSSHLQSLIVIVQAGISITISS